MRAGEIIIVGPSAHLEPLAARLRQAGAAASSVPTLGLARVNHGALVIMDELLVDPVENARMVIESGGHIVSFGAFTRDAKIQDDLLQSARDKNLLCHEGFLVTTDPALHQVQSWMREGQLGALLAVHAEDYGTQHTEAGRAVNWRHAAITALLLREVPSTIRASAHAPNGAGVPTYSVCQLLRSDGAQGVLNRTTTHPMQHERIVIVGEQATCIWSFGEEGVSQVSLHPEHGSAQTTKQFDFSQHLTSMVEAVQMLDQDEDPPFTHFTGGLSGLLGLIDTATVSKEEISMSDEHFDYFIHPTAVVDGPVEIGSETRIWHFSKLLGPLSIGHKCSLGQNVVVERNVQIGNNVKIQNNVSVYSGVILEDDVFCGPSMVFTNVGTPRSAYPRKGQYVETRVRKGASIGANATVVCGNTLGEYCFVGAGSVVTRDVPSYALVYGNPARVRGWACFCGERLALGLGSDEQESTSCPECQRTYSRDGFTVRELD